eukprot:COSAG04_NODE_648_length_11585_cov_20.935335_17_plen_40_part_01
MIGDLTIAIAELSVSLSLSLSLSSNSGQYCFLRLTSPLCF